MHTLPHLLAPPFQAAAVGGAISELIIAEKLPGYL